MQTWRIRKAANRSADPLGNYWRFSQQAVEPRALDLQRERGGDTQHCCAAHRPENIHLDWEPEADLWLV